MAQIILTIVVVIGVAFMLYRQHKLDQAEKAAKAMIEKADKDGNGMLSFEEFCSMMWDIQVKKCKKQPSEVVVDSERREELCKQFEEDFRRQQARFLGGYD